MTNLAQNDDIKGKIEQLKRFRDNLKVLEDKLSQVVVEGNLVKKELLDLIDKAKLAKVMDFIDKNI